jgi:hypothetical protein
VVLQLLDALCEGGREDWDWVAIALETQRRSGIASAQEPKTA